MAHMFWSPNRKVGDPLKMMQYFGKLIERFLKELYRACYCGRRPKKTYFDKKIQKYAKIRCRDPVFTQIIRLRNVLINLPKLRYFQTLPCLGFATDANTSPNLGRRKCQVMIFRNCSKRRSKIPNRKYTLKSICSHAAHPNLILMCRIDQLAKV